MRLVLRPPQEEIPGRIEKCHVGLVELAVTLALGAFSNINSPKARESSNISNVTFTMGHASLMKLGGLQHSQSPKLI